MQKPNRHELLCIQWEEGRHLGRRIKWGGNSSKDAATLRLLGWIPLAEIPWQRTRGWDPLAEILCLSSLAWPNSFSVDRVGRWKTEVCVFRANFVFSYGLILNYRCRPGPQRQMFLGHQQRALSHEPWSMSHEPWAMSHEPLTIDIRLINDWFNSELHVSTYAEFSFFRVSKLWSFKVSKLQSFAVPNLKNKYSTFQISRRWNAQIHFVLKIPQRFFC